MKLASLNFMSIEHSGPPSDYHARHYILLGFLLILALGIRLWGLGDISLHGDEETTAMPAIAILEKGIPVFPTGFLYLRAVGQSYCIALSVLLFGQTEWALRFPSVLAGVAGIFIAFFLGKRFLPRELNFLFVLSLALNPWHLQWSQTARMYVFFLTSLILFALTILQWSETKRNLSLVWAFLIFLVALQFHTLAIFSAFLFFYPFLKNPSRHSFIGGTTGFVAAAVTFLLARYAIKTQYQFGTSYSQTIQTSKEAISAIQFPFQFYFLAGAVFLVVLGVLLVFLKRRGLFDRPSFLLVAIGFTFTYGLAMLAQYHIAVLTGIAISAIFLRFGGKWPQLLLLVGLMCVLFVLQNYFLLNYGFFTTPRKAVKFLVGSFSILPYISFFKQFPIAAIFYVLFLVLVFVHFTRDGQLPDHVVFFIISVLCPLVLIGYFTWEPFPRYVFQFLSFFMLVCYAAIECFKRKWLNPKTPSASIFTAITALILLFSFSSPSELWSQLAYKAQNNPDHKGAAQFIQSLELDERDVILAEDVLQQYYYGVKVDYWLRSLKDAKKFVKVQDNGLYDQYTDTKLLGEGSLLENLILDKDRGDIYIITSGETYQFRYWYLADGLEEILQKYHSLMQILFTGKDNQTQVIKLPNFNG
jgi:hypothetical protein